MSYYISTHLHKGFDDAIPMVEQALSEQGFGIVTRIDMQETLKKKIGADFRPYTILGACNPKAAHEALQLEDKVGTMLPCNVIVQQVHNGLVEVAAIDPVASMQAVENPDLHEAARDIREKLAAAMSALGG
ncbi:DUF302 domain-containing protein [Qipengyuania sp. 1NDH17]|uniref:DUF302 domain-containing protein n=1 Tax=Qipengyuania polymorpha TaxID=2867234 RepID=A0ABS7IWL8_9SPHN|nr:DUF302 domain-containing protein [Qipengyuania polymorpha]MBX7456777.1 DUF302 domain-containing protein [Qipengyuania polymorpha]